MPNTSSADTPTPQGAFPTTEGPSMSDEYPVDLDQLDKVTTRMEELNAFIAESLNELNEHVTAVQTEWGQAPADTAEWAASSAKMRGGLEKMQTAAAAVRLQYEAEAAAAKNRGGENTP
ncbi:hypothetical protein ACFQZZ_33315 [Nocardia sp. GCM10030253]|uniref:hypothetical protein n=1 Tax=Nocardia sp. GCM10030253 TaxID=3273404 RepID=UPI003625EE7C